MFSDELPMMSRSGASNPSGKLTRRLDVPVSEELENAIIALATMRRMTKCEFTRYLLERTVFGELPMLQRLSGALPSGPSDESGGD